MVGWLYARSLSNVPMVGCRNKVNPDLVLAFSLSNVPMVGCRNKTSILVLVFQESIKRSDGGVSEHRRYPQPG